MPSLTRTDTIHALECPHGSEYDEEAFLYLLALEQSRARRASQRLPLLLATLEPEPGRAVAFPPSGASTLFRALHRTLRDTDVMGWYRQDHVAAAILVPRAGSHALTSTGAIEQRIGDGLRRQLAPRLAGSLRVRVVQQGPRPFDGR